MTVYYHGEEIELLAGSMDSRTGYGVVLVRFEDGEERVTELTQLSADGGLSDIRDAVEDAPPLRDWFDCTHTHVDWDYSDVDERAGFTHVFGTCRQCDRKVRRSMLHLMTVPWGGQE